MCDLTQGFKLCTCADSLDAKDADWILYRFRDLGWDEMEVGRFVYPNRWPDHELQGMALVQFLENADCFDWDYRPEERDRLVLVSDAQEHLSASFVDGAWRTEEERPVDIRLIEQKQLRAGVRQGPHDHDWLSKPCTSKEERAVRLDREMELETRIGRWYHALSETIDPVSFVPLARSISLRVRAMLMDGPILGCPGLEAHPKRRKKGRAKTYKRPPCGGSWSQLPEGDARAKRWCARCEMQVHAFDGPKPEYVGVPYVQTPLGRCLSRNIP